MRKRKQTNMALGFYLIKTVPLFSGLAHSHMASFVCLFVSINNYFLSWFLAFNEVLWLLFLSRLITKRNNSLKV